jgi:hypothetical protein
MVIFFATLIYLIWNFSQPVLLAMATVFVASGIATRLGGLLRRRVRPNDARPHSEVLDNR